MMQRSGIYAVEGNENPVKTPGMDTPRTAAGLVIGSLVALILIKRGFSGGVTGGVRVQVR